MYQSFSIIPCFGGITCKYAETASVAGWIFLGENCF